MALPSGNLLLNSLPPAVLDTLLPQFEPVEMGLRTPLFEVNAPAKYVHFIVDGVASIVTTMQDGEAVEVGIVGHEGFAEKIHLLGPQLGQTHCFMQVSGHALRMNFKRFQGLFLSIPELQEAVHRYVQHDSLVLAQLGACNRLHEVEARLARWLLMVSDRTGENDIKLTQEFLGEMLGTRRSSVNLAAGSLQRSGFISYSRGQINIADPEALETVACECYPIIAKLFHDLYR